MNKDLFAAYALLLKAIDLVPVECPRRALVVQAADELAEAIRLGRETLSAAA